MTFTLIETKTLFVKIYLLKIIVFRFFLYSIEIEKYSSICTVLHNVPSAIDWCRIQFEAYESFDELIRSDSTSLSQIYISIQDLFFWVSIDQRLCRQYYDNRWNSGCVQTPMIMKHTSLSTLERTEIDVITNYYD